MKKLHTHDNSHPYMHPEQSSDSKGREPLTTTPPERALPCSSSVGPEPDGQTTTPGKWQAQMQARLQAKADMLQWILRSRSWRYTAWLRRACFLSLRFGPRLRKPGRDPFRGEVDSPTNEGLVSQRIRVEGWAYSEGSRVAYVEVFLDTISLGHVRYGLPRLDAVVYPSTAPLACGYEGTLTVDDSLAGRRRLTIRVTDTRGRVKDFEREVQVVMPAQPAEGGPLLADSAPATVPLPVPAPPQISLPFGKKTLEIVARASLESILSSDSVIAFPHHDAPETSIVLVLYNRAELTLQCLLSILKHHHAPYEIIIINNASTDETQFLLGRVRGARIIHNQTNVHYLRACNQAARFARGRNLLLLNNDAQLLGDAVAAAAQTLDSSPDIGAVGGRIILPDGSLQEAGCIVWSDGSCRGYGRGGSPFAPEFMFQRDVDYCSAVFLLTRRELFLELGGFDESLAPAYYEDVNYCASLWRKGLRVVYDPRVSILHYESASSDSPQSVVALQVRNRKAFAGKHRQWLRSRSPASPGGELQARSPRREGQKRVLYLDDCVPHRDTGCGYPRSNRIITEMVRLGYAVTCYPLDARQEGWHKVYRDLPRELEVVQGRGLAALTEFLVERAGYYDIVYVSRPHNLAQFRKLLLEQPQICSRARIIYDSEALASLRETERLRVRGKAVSESEHADSVTDEVQLARHCHSVVSVSELDGREFTRHGFKNVYTVGHSLVTSPTPRGFDERRDILFVGAVHGPDSPNADSVTWFARRVLPIVRKELGQDVKFLVAGDGSRDFFSGLTNGSVKVLGHVEELAELYDRARLFVAPTRFSAGIPLKVLEAAAHGLPVAATTLLGRQLGWAGGEELLLADGAEAFAAACVKLYRDAGLWSRIRENALRRVEADCCPSQFSERIRAILGGVGLPAADAGS